MLLGFPKYNLLLIFDFTAKNHEQQRCHCTLIDSCVGVFGCKFPPLSYFCERRFFPTGRCFPTGLASEAMEKFLGVLHAVSSRRRSCCPSGASCCDGLEEWRCGDEMADLMKDSFMRTKMAQYDPGPCQSLSHKNAFHVGDCEQTVLYVIHAVCILCTSWWCMCEILNMEFSSEPSHSDFCPQMSLFLHVQLVFLIPPSTNFDSDGTESKFHICIFDLGFPWIAQKVGVHMIPCISECYFWSFRGPCCIAQQFSSPFFDNFHDAFFQNRLVHNDGLEASAKICACVADKGIHYSALFRPSTN